MAFSATNTCTGTGNWNNAGIWSGGIPDIDDEVLITGGFTVTANVDFTFADLHVTGGVLAFTAGVTGTVKDAAGTHATGEHIRIASAANSGWNSNGAAGSPVVFESENTGAPSYQIKFLIEDVTTAETRTMDWSYMDIRDAACFIGNDTRYVWFNTGDITNDGILDDPLPVTRDQKIDAHYIEGRAYGRVYRDGGHAGTTQLNGMVPWASYDWQLLADMRDNGDKVAFQGRYVQMPSARIEALTYGRRNGPYLPFSLTLIEDI